MAWSGPIRHIARKDRGLYGAPSNRGKNPNIRRSRPVSPELKKEILRLFLVFQGPDQTVSGIIQAINRRLNQPRSKEAAIRTILGEAAANGKIQLPSPTKRGGAKK